MSTVSVVLAAWNPHPEWLEQQVRSVLAERDVVLDLVVVDDGSDVPVAGALEGVDDERLRLVRIEHAGESVARNAGIEAARGDYLRFVDADDVVAPGSTAHLLRLAEAKPGAIAFGATAVCDERLRPIWTMRSKLDGDVARACLLGRWWVRIPSLLFPRSVVEAAGPWDTMFRLSHDWDFVLRALDHAPVTGDGTVVTYYRKHARSATADTRGSEEGARRVVARFFERHPELRGTRLERQAEASVESLAARVLVSRRRPTAALPRLGRAFVRDPGSIANELSQALPALAGIARSRAQRAPQDGS